MNISEKSYLSREKFEELKQELDFLTTTRRKEIAEKLEYAKALGDLSENAEYQEAREDQANTEERIAQVESLLRSAEIISNHKGDVVDVGSTVTLQKEGSDSTQKYKIVGAEEADVSQKKISNESPLGEAVVDKKKGEEIIVQTPSGEVKYKILKVE